MRLDLSIDDVPGALIVYDADGKVVEANEAASGLLGHSRDHLLATSAEESGWLITDPDGRRSNHNTHPALAVARSGDTQAGVLARVDRADGTRAWIQVDASPVRSSDGELRCVIATLTDVTAIVVRGRLNDLPSDDRTLADITDQIASARLDPEEILRIVTATLSRLRSGTWVASLITKDQRTVRMIGANDADPMVAGYIERLNLTADAATTVALRVIETGEPVLLPAVQYDEFIATLSPEVRALLASRPPPVRTAPRYLGVMVVPMRARGATVGTLGLFERRTSNPLTEADVRWLQAIADRTGLAAENAQLYVDATSRLDRLTRLRNVGLAVSVSPDLRLILQVILDQVTAGTDVDAADVLLLDHQDGMLSMAASAGFQFAANADVRLPVDEGIVGRVISGRRIETVTTSSDFSQFRRRTLFAREGFKTYRAVPLIGRGNLLGVLEVFNRTVVDPDQEWLAFLEAIASEAAIAIDKAAMLSRLEAVPPVKVRNPPPDLTQLEKVILGYLVEGVSNKDIATKVHLSPHTVKFHVHKLLQELGASNRTELARKATKEDWL
ncbi:MAG TPA: GAF domain-containing protein [Candidatus Dormibacteraeota bacterium]|jgi:PAS domain S-box-containing protein